jgi:hypothetical protein
MGVCTQQACPFGATRCGNACVDLSSSPQNCGACGTICPSGQVCDHGACTAACAAGETACGTACVDLKHDSTNCGSCGTVCSNDQICATEGAQVKCRDYRYAGCLSCPCTACGERACCAVPTASGAFAVLCVEDQCPAP